MAVRRLAFSVALQLAVVFPASAADTLAEYLSAGYELKAVSEAGGERSGTTLWLQKSDQIVFCPLMGVVGRLDLSEKPEPQMQMFPCTELMVDPTFMFELDADREQVN